jgi:AcrR family transcriptional regulator
MAKTTRNLTKDMIINAVEEVITSQGVNSFSLKDLSKKLDISQGTLYYYYKSKDELILDLMKKHMNELSHDYVEWLKRHNDGSLTASRFLDVIFYKGLHLFNRAKIHIYLINECLSSSPSLREEYTRMWEEWKKSIAVGVKAAFPEEKDPDAYAYLLMLLIDGLTIQQAMQRTDPEEEKIKGLLLNLGDAKK